MLSIVINILIYGVLKCMFNFNTTILLLNLANHHTLFYGAHKKKLILHFYIVKKSNFD